MTDNRFFDETTEQSAVKAVIVSKYLWAWAKVIIPTVKRHGGKIAYMDLFAGPGRYKDGTKSTPLLVLEAATKDQDLSRMLMTLFNDRDEANCRSLEAAIAEIPGIGALKYPPDVYNKEVGTEMVKQFERMRLVPTLFFVDPWGYRGLSLQLVNAVVKDWACECVFFFNYTRVNMGLGNPSVKEHMDALFGEAEANALRDRLESLEPDDRELTIVEELCQALNPKSDRFVLPFRFRNDRGTRTSHHLIFVSKSFLGYHIMKGVMARESSKKEQGVASLEYSPADRRYPLLFEFARPLDDLKGMLLNDLAGKKVTFKKLYEAHSVGKPYTDSNYKDVLKSLEDTGNITVELPGRKRRGQSFPEDILVTFPPKGA